jgi:hypothetical protein
MHLTDFQDFVKELIKDHDIKVVRKRFKSAAGRAWVQDKRIKIPKMIDYQTTGTALHEVVHVILGHKDDEPDYIVEYETETITIKLMKKCKMDIDYKAEFEYYVEGSKLNVKDHVERYVKIQEKLGKKPKIRKKILDWLSNESI